MKAIIQGNLDLSKKYNIVGTFYLKNDDFSVCEDCGRVIKKVAIISDGLHKYHIGFDCLQKILSTNKILSNVFEMDTYKDGIATMIKIANYTAKNECSDIKVSEYNGQVCVGVKANGFYKMFYSSVLNKSSIDKFISENYNPIV